METEYHVQMKRAASHLTTIAEALREVAWTESGETDDPIVELACAVMLNFAGKLDSAIVSLKNGRRPQLDVDGDMPF